MLSRADAVAALRGAGVTPGDVALVQSSLLRCGPVEAERGRDGVLGFWRSCLAEVLGPEGTLVVLTAFEDYARHGTPFDRTTSPSLSGALSEHVRTSVGAVRSQHPIVSLTAIGPRATEICGGRHLDGFGWTSPWAQLHRLDARIVTIGYAVVPDGMTFLHYVERLYGVPYQYTKLYDFPVLDAGRTVAGPFTMSVRYLDYDIENDQRRLKQRLVDAGAATVLPLGRGELLVTRAVAAVDEGCALLDEDRWGLLVRPPAFRAGELPFDGTTGPLPEASERDG